MELALIEKSFLLKWNHNTLHHNTGVQLYALLTPFWLVILSKLQTVAYNFNFVQPI